MQCPVCSETQLVVTTRESIEIDYCPKCRGVWLDRGELDKIIERSQPDLKVSSTTSQPAQQLYSDPYAGGHGHRGKHDKHGSLLRRLFD